MDKKFMDIAFKEAEQAFFENEVPVGVVIVKKGEILSQRHNKKDKSKSVINHAEILALLECSNKINDWRLNECEMYVTLEPCPMCASAIQQSRIKKVYIGSESNISSNKKIMREIFENDDNYHRVEFEYLNDKRCSDILSIFFEKKR